MSNDALTYFAFSTLISLILIKRHTRRMIGWTILWLDHPLDTVIPCGNCFTVPSLYYHTIAESWTIRERSRGNHALSRAAFPCSRVREQRKDVCGGNVRMKQSRRKRNGLVYVPIPSTPKSSARTESRRLRFHVVAMRFRALLRREKGFVDEKSLAVRAGPSRANTSPPNTTAKPRECDARDATGRRSRLFRNGDAPASRIAEGLHCASATRASSTQPPRTARGTAPVCDRGR